MFEMVPKFFWGDASEIWIKNEKWLQIIGTDMNNGKVLFIAAEEAH